VWWLLACSSDGTKEARAALDPVAEGLTWVSCTRGDRTPAVGCLYRGTPDAIAAVLAKHQAAPAQPRNVSWSPCVHRDRTLGVQLPGSEDWFTREGVTIHRFGGGLPVGDVYVLGEHVCLEALN
jgi:hypothetical protein